LILAYKGLEEENLDQKSPGPPGWGLMQQTSPLLIEKQEFLKNPLETTKMLWTLLLLLLFLYNSRDLSEWIWNMSLHNNRQSTKES
jgi:hypothetical protein